jgi:hypothetical protein
MMSEKQNRKEEALGMQEHGKHISIEMNKHKKQYFL